MDYDVVKGKLMDVCSDCGEAVNLGKLNGNRKDLGTAAWRVPVKLKFYCSNSEWEISPGEGRLLVALDEGRNVVECTLCGNGDTVKTWTCDIGAIEGIYAEYKLRDEGIMKPLAELVETMK